MRDLKKYIRDDRDFYLNSISSFTNFHTIVQGLCSA